MKFEIKIPKILMKHFLIELDRNGLKYDKEKHSPKDDKRYTIFSFNSVTDWNKAKKMYDQI